MKRYLNLILLFIFLWSIFSAPFFVSAHDADGIYYNKDLIDGLDDYRNVKLYWSDNSEVRIKKPVSSMTVVTNGKSYKDNGSEDIVSATIEINTPIEIDFSDSEKLSEYSIAEIGLQITNGTGEKMDWSSLPNGKEDTAYASQYPFSTGKVSFTPQKAGTYKIYGEVRADIDRSQILYGWDAWSHNGSHGEYADMIGHSSPPAGEIKAYPVKWHFEVVVIKVVDKLEETQGSITVNYIDGETDSDLMPPVVMDGLPEGTHKSITAPGVEGYLPDTYMMWSDTDSDDEDHAEEDYQGTIGIDITKENMNWVICFIYKKFTDKNESDDEISANIVKVDGLNKFGYDPQWAAELYKGYEELGYTYRTVFDMALMDKGCYPNISWDSQVNFDNIKSLVETARKYRVEVTYKWKKTYHYERRNKRRYKVANPAPTANITLNTSTSGIVTTQISYNIANGEDAEISTQQITSTDEINFDLRAGETKTFEFSMPLYSQMYPNTYSSFQEYDEGTAIISAEISAKVSSKRCSSCGRTITYSQPDNVAISKNIAIMPAKVFDHYMHLGE